MHSIKCGVACHFSCFGTSIKETPNGEYTCKTCQYAEKYRAMDLCEESHYRMCFQKGGTLVYSRAKPVSMKKCLKNPTEFRRSLFGKQKIWCHALCGM